jgi:rhodanese-related sulfurtransferase
MARAQRVSNAGYETAGGVLVTGIVEDPSDLKIVYDPTHPDANEEGYVELPNVDTVKEMTDAIAASQAIEPRLALHKAVKPLSRPAFTLRKRLHKNLHHRFICSIVRPLNPIPFHPYAHFLMHIIPSDYKNTNKYPKTHRYKRILLLILRKHKQYNTMMKKLFRLIPFCALLFSCSADDRFKSVSVEEFEALITDTTVQRLDVRTPEEYAEGHIAGSININVNDESFELKALDTLDKDRTVALYCRSGRRSKKAATILSDNGYQVVELATGINGWIEKDKDTIK